MMHRRALIVSGLGIAALLWSVAATSQQSATQPSPNVAKVVAGEFVWHDLITHDPVSCRAFYGALFGWTFEDGKGIDPNYTIIRHEGRLVGGIVPLRRPDADAPVAQWLAYVVVPDVDKATETFRETGGRIFRGPLNARKDLRVAVVADSQGAPLGLASRGPVLEEENPPALHRWLWMEYVALDPAAALTFYGQVVGFDHEVYEVRNNFTYYLLTTSRPRAGLFRSPWDRETSAWLPYVRVADPAAMAAQAEKLGGTVALRPRPEVRNGSLAIVLDPTGAPLALQKFPFDAIAVAALSVAGCDEGGIGIGVPSSGARWSGPGPDVLVAGGPVYR
jgi:predicted enzyme related to lactoylglutathione lyase